MDLKTWFVSTADGRIAAPVPSQGLRSSPLSVFSRASPGSTPKPAKEAQQQSRIIALALACHTPLSEITGSLQTSTVAALVEFTETPAERPRLDSYVSQSTPREDRHRVQCDTPSQARAQRYSYTKRNTWPTLASAHYSRYFGALLLDEFLTDRRASDVTTARHVLGPHLLDSGAVLDIRVSTRPKPPREKETGTQTYGKHKVQHQRHHQGDADDQRTDEVIEILAAAAENHLPPQAHHAVAPNTRKHGDDDVRDTHDLGQEVLSGGRVQRHGQRAEQDADVLPLEERALVGQPHLGLDLQLARVLDPLGRFDDALGQLLLVVLRPPGLGVLGQREAREDGRKRAVAPLLLAGRPFAAGLGRRLLRLTVAGPRAGAGLGCHPVCEVRLASRRALGHLVRADLVAQEAAHGLLVLGSLSLALLLGLERLLGVLADVGLQVAQPEGQAVDVVLKQRGNAVDELGEAGRRVHQVGSHQVRNPRGALAVGVLLQLDLEDGVREPGHLALVDILERVPAIDVETVPVRRVAARPVLVQSVFADEGDLGVDGDAHPVVRGLLEGRTGVVGAQHGLQLVLLHEALQRLDRVLEVLDLVGLLTLALHLLHRLLHLVGAVDEGLDVLVLDGELALLARSVLADNLLFEVQLGLRAQLAVPPDAQRRRLRLALHLLPVQVELGAVEVERRDGRVVAAVQLLGRLFAVDEGREPSHNVVGVDPELVGRVPLAVARLALALQVQRLLVGGALVQLLPNGIVHDGQLVEQRRVPLLRVEGPLRQAQLHHGPHLVPVAPLAVVLLDDLEEARVVDVAVLLQLRDLGRDLVELRLDVLQLLGRRGVGLLGLHVLRAVLRIGRRQLLELLKGRVDTVLQGLERLLLELGDLLELGVEDLVAKAVLVVLGPGDVLVIVLVLPQQGLELRVVDVLVLPRRVDGLPQRLSEAHGGGRQMVGSGRWLQEEQEVYSIALFPARLCVGHG
ncbi:LOW QUALITY PROTEIN: hypothetical protein ColTof3_04701 [Colletotrichum tofieldiae]|nr:LOW QUALITY PROTEIN: hypothetical protein ColTof3_04701 [Colletotrichum tofieldiae]